MKIFPHQETAPPVGVGEMGVAGVDNQVVRGQQREHFPNYRVYRIAGGHQQDNGPRPFQQPDKFLQVITGPDSPGARFLVQEFSRFFGGAVIYRHRKPVVRHVQDKIAPHGPQADEADVTTLAGHKILHSHTPLPILTLDGERRSLGQGLGFMTVAPVSPEPSPYQAGAGSARPPYRWLQKAWISSQARAEPVTRPPRHMMFISSSSTPWWAEKGSVISAARAPDTLLAATQAPTPLPQMASPRATSPVATARARGATKSG